MNKKLPDSEDWKPAKRAEGIFPHGLYAHELKELLAKIPDHYWMLPNKMGNLLFGEDGREDAIGIIDTHWRHLDTWGQPLSEEDPRSYPLEENKA